MADKIKILLAAQDKTKAAFKSANKNMDKLKKSSKLLSAALGPIGAFASAGAILLIGKQAISAADDIQKMSQRLDISTEALSQYQHVAALSGTNFEVLAKGIAKSQRAIADADDGLSTAVRAIEDMGLSVAELKSLKPEDAFERMGAAMASIKDPYTRASVAANVFGRAGKDLLPIFKDGAEGVKKMRDEADRFHLTLSKDMADAAADAADSVEVLGASWRGFAQTLAIMATPAITNTSKALAELIVKSNKLFEIFEQQKRNNEAEAWAERVQAAIEEMRQSEDGIPDDFLSGFMGKIDFPALREYVGEILRASDAVNGWGTALNGIPDTSEMFDFGSKIAPVVGPVKELGAAFTEIDLAMSNLAQGEEILGFWDGLDRTIPKVKKDVVDLNVEVSETAQILEQQGIRASDAFGDAIVDAALRGENALTSLGNVARSVFGQIISSFLGIGIRSINPFAGASPVSPDFIGPLKSMAPAGATNNFGGITVNANSTLNTDPMSIRRLAEQIQNELDVVAKHRGVA